MVMVPPEVAASMQGPKPASYWRSSSWTASGPVKATLATSPSRRRVTDTSAAPGIVCLASSATRSRVADSGCPPSMILLSSAKAARGSRGGSMSSGSGLDTAVSALRRTVGSHLATVQEVTPSALHERTAGTRTEPHCCWLGVGHRDGATTPCDRATYRVPTLRVDRTRSPASPSPDSLRPTSGSKPAGGAHWLHQLRPERAPACEGPRSNSRPGSQFPAGAAPTRCHRRPDEFEV